VASVITRHGKPCAAMVSVQDLEDLEERRPAMRSDFEGATSARHQRGTVPAMAWNTHYHRCVNRCAVVNLLQVRVPKLQAVYAFGSRVQGTAGPHSDLDLAVLAAGRVDPLRLWDCAGELADVVGCSVDLVDLCAASTVMQYQVITTGECWWRADALDVGLFEAAVLSEKTALNEARAGLMADIEARGTVYGR
jgi:predicted nucleotidyltransferase